MTFEKSRRKRYAACDELVRLKGLEPTRIAAREPKSRMSTNSITGAYSVFPLRLLGEETRGGA